MGNCLSCCFSRRPPPRTSTPDSFPVREAWLGLPECCKFARRADRLCCVHDVDRNGRPRKGGVGWNGGKQGRGPPVRDEKGKLVRR
jgi:hypothetical protein